MPYKIDTMSEKWRSLRRYTLLVCVAAVAAVVLAEWILATRSSGRLTIPFYNRLYPYVMFRPHENARFISHDVQLASNIMSHNTRTVHYYTNEDGFRVEELEYRIPRRKPGGQLRVAMLGSSAVQLGTTFANTLPGSLRRALKERFAGRDVEVINAGIQSCVARQSIAYLLFTLVDYQPDVVVLYDGFNDLMFPLNYESRSNFPYNFQTMESAWEEYRSEHQTPLWQLALNRSHLYRGLHAALSESQEEIEGLHVGRNAKSPPAIAESPEWVRDHVTAYLTNWVKFIELSRVYGYQPVCVLQPTAVLDPVFGPKVTAEGYQLSKESAAEWVQALSVLYAEGSRQVGELRQQHPDITILDMSRALLPSEKHFWDVVHVYDETNDLLAKTLIEEIPSFGETGDLPADSPLH